MNEFEKQLKEDLEAHVKLEFQRKDFNVLNEERGIVPYIDNIINPIVSSFMDQYKADPNQDEYVIHKTAYKSGKELLFFNQLKVVIDMGPKVKKDSGDYIMSPTPLTKTNKIYRVTIKVGLTKGNWIDRRLTVLLAHEMTHAWEDYQRRIKGGETLYDYSIKKNYTGTNLDENDETWVMNLKNLMYSLFQMETHAFVGSVWNDLKYDHKEIIDRKKRGANDFMDLIMFTDAGKHITATKDLVDYFSSQKLPESQKLVLDKWNEISDYKFDSYKALARSINFRWQKIYNKFVSVASKAVYDVYTSHVGKDIMYLDGRIMKRMKNIGELKGEICERAKQKDDEKFGTFEN